MFSPLLRTSIVALLCAGAAGAQTVEPTVREIFKTDTNFVHGVVEPASGRFIAYATENEIRVWNRATGKTTTIPGAIAPQFGNSLSLNAAGSTIVFARPSEDHKQRFIWRLDLDSLTGAARGEARRISLAPSQNASISPDGKWVAMAAINGAAAPTAVGHRLVVIPSEGGDARMLDSAMQITSPRWTPDSRNIVYQRGGAIARIPVSGGARDSLSEGTGVIGVSPDGKYIAFAPPWGGGTHPVVRVIDQSGRVRARFVQNERSYGRIYDWSRTEPGRLVAFRALHPSQPLRVTLGSGASTPYTLTDEYVSSTHYSPDGKTLAYIGRAGDRDQLVVFDTTTHQRRVLDTAEQPDACDNPCADWHWSPDGKSIGFLSTDPTSGHYVLSVVDVATSKAHRVADLGQAYTFRWQSDSRGLQYVFADQSASGVSVDIRGTDLAGHSRLIKSLPFTTLPPPRGLLNNLKLLSDNLAMLGSLGAPKRADSIMTIPLNGGAMRTIYHGRTSRTGNLTMKLSPDGKSLALTVPGLKTGDSWAVMSLDGKTLRRIGNEMDAFCGGGINQWTSNGKRILAWGAHSCDDWREEPFLIDLDAGTATRVMLPKGVSEDDGVTLVPNGNEVLVSASKPSMGHVVSLDLSRVFISRAGEEN